MRDACAWPLAASQEGTYATCTIRPKKLPPELIGIGQLVSRLSSV
jgi:hypothetical protein